MNNQSYGLSGFSGASEMSQYVGSECGMQKQSSCGPCGDVHCKTDSCGQMSPRRSQCGSCGATMWGDSCACMGNNNSKNESQTAGGHWVMGKWVSGNDHSKKDGKMEKRRNRSRSNSKDRHSSHNMNDGKMWGDRYQRNGMNSDSMMMHNKNDRSMSPNRNRDSQRDMHDERRGMSPSRWSQDSYYHGEGDWNNGDWNREGMNNGDWNREGMNDVDWMMAHNKQEWCGDWDGHEGGDWDEHTKKYHQRRNSRDGQKSRDSSRSKSPFRDINEEDHYRGGRGFGGRGYGGGGFRRGGWGGAGLGAGVGLGLGLGAGAALATAPLAYGAYGPYPYNYGPYPYGY
jgi:hypothetical protein